MKSIYKTIALNFLSLSLLTACSETPMEKLQKEVLEPSIATSFWTKEIKENPDLWQEALTYCRAHPRKVNCKAVRRAWGQYNQRKMIQAGSTKEPAYGSNADDVLHVPY